MANYIDEEVKKGNFNIWFKGKTDLPVLIFVLTPTKW